MRHPTANRPDAKFGEPQVLQRCARFVVLNKPGGLPVHAGPRRGPSVEDWFPQLSRRRTGPWLAHRIDADTSGCLVIALTKTALIEAQAEFANGRAEKTYWAVVSGTPTTASGRIDAPLLKITNQTGWRMIVDPKGQHAASDWQILATNGSLSLLEVRPRTGRTHQVRAHCAALGTPIEGDPIYGNANGPMQLLARQIHLPLTPPLRATAPMPPHMMASWSRGVWGGSGA